MTTAKRLLLLFVLAGGASALFGQGACTTQNLTCAGQFASYATVSPALRAMGSPCYLGTLVGMSGAPDPGVSYLGNFGGGYQDFVTQADGSLAWSSVQVPVQSLFGHDSCYQPCNSSVDISAMGCPSLTGSISAANALWIKPDYGLDGGLTGGTPEFQSGGETCNSYDMSVTIGVAAVTAHITQCSAVVDVYNDGTDTGAPNHCTYIYITNTPPTCVCGWTANCINNQYSCPNNNNPSSTQTYYAQYTCDPYPEDPTISCICTYLIQDDYTCGTLVDETATLIDVGLCNLG